MQRAVHMLFFAAWAMVVAGCASAADGDSAAEPVKDAPAVLAARSLHDAPTTTTTTSTTTTTTIAPPLETGPLPGVVITETEIVAPVLAETPQGWIVRTPCQNITIVPDGQLVERVHVVIDPGHGGLEPGAVTEDGLAEKDVNFAVAELVELKLNRLDVEVVLTRYTDDRIPLATRAEIADRLGAALLISIHHQGRDPFPTSDEPGTEIYYQQDNADSKRIAGLIREEALEQLGAFDITWFAGSDAGATYRPNADTGEDFYGMVRIPETPAVLAEMAFLGNPEEVALLQTRAFLDAEATAISNAVVRFFTTEDPGVGFVEPSFGLRSSGGGGGLAGCSDPDMGETIDPTEEQLASITAPTEDG